MSITDVIQNLNMTCSSMSDQGSVMDNLSFDDFDPSQGSLEFYEDFVDMKKMANTGRTDSEELYAQLEQKEKDLILAAELGKALLERNEELAKKQDQLHQELADRMEELEQERYHHRRRLEVMEGEYEIKLLDLQTEMSSLQEELTNQKAAQKALEREKQTAVSELSEHNQKLIYKLKQASDVEEELNEHIQRLRGQVHLRRQHSLNRETTGTQANEDLQKEVQRLSAKRGELERRLQAATSDRETLASSLKETDDRCHVLEKRIGELEQELGSCHAELEKLRQANNDTAEELEELRYQASFNLSTNTAGFHGCSLLSELGLEMTGPGRGTGVDHGADQEEEDEDDEIECDEIDGQVFDDVNIVGVNQDMKQDHKNVKGHDEPGGGPNCLCQEHGCSLKQQMLQDVLNEVHTTLSNLSHELKAHVGVSSSPIGSPCHFHAKVANERSQQGKLQTEPDVRNLLRDLTSVTRVITKKLDMANKMTSGSPTETDLEALESHIVALRGELSSTQSHIELLKSEIDRRDEELKRKDSELCVLAAKVRNLEQELQLSATSCDETDLSSVSSEDDKEDRSQLCVRKLSSCSQDVSSNISQDEIIERLQNERDEAIRRRTVTENELSQTKDDMNKLDDQLIGAIKQKVSLSEQLDQWQIDIHQLLDQRLKKQLIRHEVTRRLDVSKPKASPQKRFPFWS